MVMYSVLCYVELLVVLAVALATDILYGKIMNSLVMAAFSMSLAIHFYYGGGDGLITCIGGFVYPMLIFMPLFLLRALGAGDIKLFGAIGSIMGLKFALGAAAAAFCLGGLAAIILVIWKKELKQRLKNILRYFIRCLLTLTLLPYEDGLKFKFTPVIAAGVFVQFIYKIGGGVLAI